MPVSYSKTDLAFERVSLKVFEEESLGIGTQKCGRLAFLLSRGEGTRPDLVVLDSLQSITLFIVLV